MIVQKSTRKNKKYMALFKEGSIIKKTTHFGSKGMSDFTLSRNEEQRARYRTRHKKDLRTRDPMRAGYLSYYLLWGQSTSLRQNIKTYKKRFNFD